MMDPAEYWYGCDAAELARPPENVERFYPKT